MKKIMLFLASLCPALSLGQTQPTNGGFEEWVIQDSFLTPVGWENYFFSQEPSPAVFQQIDDPFAGDYALYIFPESQFEGYWPQGKKTKVLTSVLPKSMSVAMQCFDVVLDGFCEVRLDGISDDGSAKNLVSLKLTSETAGYIPFSVPISQAVSNFEHLEITCRAGSFGLVFADGNATMVVDEIFLAYDMAPGSSAVNELEIYVFPNPATERLYVSLPTLPGGGEISFHVFDTQGKLMKKWVGEPSEMPSQIDVNHWHSGLYLLQIEREGKILKLEKFTVAHR